MIEPSEIEKQSPISNFGDKLNQWKPGQSGNPGGRPKGKSITARLRKILDSEYTDGRTVADHIVDIVVKEILKPSGKYGFNTGLLKEILDRTEGKVTIPIGGDKEKPFYNITVESKEAMDDLKRVIAGEGT